MCFRLCDKIDHTNILDLAGFFSNTAGNFEGVVQYNKDNRAFEVSLLDYTCREVVWLAPLVEQMLSTAVSIVQSTVLDRCVFIVEWNATDTKCLEIYSIK